MDLMQTASLNNFDTNIIGSTNDYSKTANSNICVITSGIPRKPGMSREELIGINSGIVKSVTSKLLEHSPDTILIVVSNPMDSMTYLVHKTTKLPRNRIIGMGGSILGTEAIYNFLRHKIKKRFYFFNNLNVFFNKINNNKTLNLIVSKSGNTLETISNANILINKRSFNKH